MKTFAAIKAFTQQQNATPYAAGVINSALQYTAISKHEAYLTGLKSQEHILGQTHYDLPCPMSQSAPELQRQYKKIIATKKSLQILNIHTSAQGNLGIYLTDKIPHLDKQNKVDEIAYYCHEQRSEASVNLALSSIQQISKFRHKSKSISVTYELINKYDDFGLSIRESEIYYYLIRSHTAKSIANILNISNRTVETHIENIKLKLDCNTRYALVDYAYIYGLLYLIPLSLLKLNIDI